MRTISLTKKLQIARICVSNNATGIQNSNFVLNVGTNMNVECEIYYSFSLRSHVMGPPHWSTLQ